MIENAVEVIDVYKKFRLFHEKRNTVFETLTGFFNRKTYYEDLNVLQGISFVVKKGEMLGIIGRNGAGKTTLLRIISKVYKPDKGKVSMNGTFIPILSLGVGFQEEMTAKNNIIQYGLLLGFKKKEITELTSKIIEFAELEHFEDTKIKNFSSGMKARLAFATAAHVNSDILIMDESMAVGDMGFQEKCFKTLKKFRDEGKSIIFVGHDSNSIIKHCDRAILLSHGKLIKEGLPRDVIDVYKEELENDKNSKG